MNQNLVNRGEMETGDEENVAFSIKQLKHNLKDTLKKSGVLSTVKAQIRQEFINGLSSKNSAVKKDVMDISDRIIYSSIYHLLRNRQLLNSISVFTAETCLDPKLSLLSEEDIIRMVKFNALSKTFTALHSGKSVNQYDDALVPMPPKMIEHRQTTALDLMVYFCLSSGDNRREISTQTEAGGASAREVLNDRIHELRNTYKVSREVELLNPSKTIEERMVAYQRDCERRLQSDVALQVAHIREHELARVRLDEAQKHRLESEHMRKTLENEYNRRLQQHIDKEAQSAKRLSDQEHSTQRAMFESRQVLQREIDELRTRESSATRKQELESQGVRLLELRLKESLSLIDAREADIARRERQLEDNRTAAVSEARREAHAKVAAELEILTRDRAALLMEKALFSDVQASQAAIVESCKGVREQLRASQEEVVCREEEVSALQRQLQRLALQREEEAAQIRKMVAQVDPSFGALSTAEQVIALVRQNADLQVKLGSYKEAGLLQQRLADKQQECAQTEAALREVKSQLETESKQFQLERDQLQSAVLAEKTKVASYAHKLEELRQLLGDKSKAIDSLRRQLEGGSGAGVGAGGSVSSGGGGVRVQRSAGGGSVASALTSPAGGYGGSLGAGSRKGYSSSDFKALEILRNSGHFSDMEGATAVNASASSQQVDQLSTAVLDSILQKLNAHPRAPPSAAPQLTNSAAPPAPVYSAVPSATVTAGALTSSADAAEHARLAEEQAQRSAALVRERQHAAELSATLQREQLKAAELTAQIEQQKLTSAHLSRQAERERLQAAEAARVRDQELASALDRERAQLREQQEQLAKEKLAVAQAQQAALREQQPAAVPVHAASSVHTTHTAGPSVATPVLNSKPVAAVPRQDTSSYDVQPITQVHVPVPVSTWAPVQTPEDDFDVLEDTEVASSLPQQHAESAAQKAESDRQAHEALARNKRIAELAAEDEARIQAELLRKEKQEQQRILQAQEDARLEQLEAQRTEERRLAKDQQEADRVAQAAATAAAALTAQQAADAEAQAQQTARLAAERAAAAALHKERELELENQRIREQERLAQEIAEREREAAQQRERAAAEAAAETEAAQLAAAHAAAEAEALAAAQAAAEAEALATAQAAAHAEEQRKKDEDAAEIMEARARVLARRQKKKELDQPFMSASLPTSLQSAAAGGAGGGAGAGGASNAPYGAARSQEFTSFSGVNTTVSGSANQSLGVSASLDSASGFRPQPARNLFGNNPSFQSLQDSDDSSDGGKMEVGDVSDDHEGDKSIW